MAEEEEEDPEVEVMSGPSDDESEEKFTDDQFPDLPQIQHLEVDKPDTLDVPRRSRVLSHVLDENLSAEVSDAELEDEGSSVSKQSSKVSGPSRASRQSFLTAGGMRRSSQFGHEGRQSILLSTEGSSLGGIQIRRQKDIFVGSDIEDGSQGQYSVKFSPRGQFLACGGRDGLITVVNYKSGMVRNKLKHRSHSTLPVTCLKWKSRVSDDSGREFILLSANSSGFIDFWHVGSEQCIQSIQEKNNQIFSIDVSPTEKFIASGGSDKTVRVYDTATQKLSTQYLNSLRHVRYGHSNRIFCTKFDRNDENILVTGGWDDTVFVWDLRSKIAARTFFGPHIAGESIDLNSQSSRLVTGSWRQTDTLQVWDFNTGKLVKTANDWKQPSMAYSCHFCTWSGHSDSDEQSNEFIAVGGTSANEVRLFHSDLSSKSGPLWLKDKQGIYSLDYSTENSCVAIAGESNYLSLFSLNGSLT